MKRKSCSFLLGTALVVLDLAGGNRLLGVEGFGYYVGNGDGMPRSWGQCEHPNHPIANKAKKGKSPFGRLSRRSPSSSSSTTRRIRKTTVSLSAANTNGPDDQWQQDPDTSIAPRKDPLPIATINWNAWISTGISAVFLAQFASLYTQLPGLFGSTPHGLLPIANRMASLEEDLWIMNFMTAATNSPEWAMEGVCATGLMVAAAQIAVGRRLHTNWPGLVTYGILWVCWHDLILAGGRFLQYQMDTLLLDVAPIVVISCWGGNGNNKAARQAANFGYRWLLARLYLGAGSVKLLSCDASWRDLSAVHWHFQSQPLPNPVGVWAYEHLPMEIGLVLTWGVLVGEMALPFLFLAPSKGIRQFAFVRNLVLMVGIATFGNFGTLQAVLIIVGFSLLAEDEYNTVETTALEGSGNKSNKSNNEISSSGNSKSSGNTDNRALLLAAASAVSLALAAAGTFWAVHDIGARCIDTLPIEPLVYDFIALGVVVAQLPLLLGALKRRGRQERGSQVRSGVLPMEPLDYDVGALGKITAWLPLAFNALGRARAEGGPLVTTGLFLFLLASSVTTIGVEIPFESFWDEINIGAQQYGLFAIMTGVGGRPVAVLEGAISADGPWIPIPLLYQVNDPSGPLSFCFPHFPRLDWTLWFVPMGDSGLWIARLFQGITVADPAIVGLLDKHAFDQRFPIEPPAIVRVVPKIYQWEGSQWQVSNDVHYSDVDVPVMATYKRGDLYDNTIDYDESSSSLTWPSTPLLRPLASSMRPEYFIWASLGTSVAARRIIQDSLVTDWTEDD